MSWTNVKIYVDGACKTSTGEMGCGVYVTGNYDGKEREGTYNYYLGKGTCNEAEYYAVILGLIRRNELHGSLSCDIYSDSKLIVEQIRGRWEVKAGNLVALNVIAIRLYNNGLSTIKHIPREQNQVADELAKESLEESTMMRLYG